MSMIIDGTNGLTFNNATTQASAGNVLQVVQATYATATSTSSTSFVDGGLSGTITPKFSTSKILVEVIHNGVGKGSQNVNNCAFFRLVKNGSTLYYIDEDVGFTGTTISQNVGSSAFSYLDSAGGTSPIVYSTQFANYNNGNIVWLNNYSLNAARTNSTMTLWEIAG